MPQGWPITGVDCAYLQKEIDFAAARQRDNVTLSWTRFGQGGGPGDRSAGYWPDPWAKRHFQTAKGHNFRGAYWVYDTRRASGAANTDAFLNVIEDVGLGECDPWSDLEVAGFDWDEYHQHLIDIEQRAHRQPIIYTGSYVMSAKGSAPGWLKDYKFVLTGYNDTGPNLWGPLAEVITIEENVIGWQQTSSWHPGWVTGIDRDYFRAEIGRHIHMSDKYVPVDKLLQFIADNTIEIDPGAPPPEPPPPTPDPTKLELIWPVDGAPFVTQWYGVNKAYYSQFGLPGHEGLDLRAYNGTRIFAAAAGRVYLSTPNQGNYGIQVRIAHQIGDQQFNTVYAHLMQTEVEEGDIVEQGQVVGLADNTGNSSGAHLHFTLKLEGIGEGINDGSYFPSNIINPVPYLKDLFPGPGWQVLSAGNLRPQPTTEGTVPIRLLSVGARVQALEALPTDWWKVDYNGQVGWFWNPGYKLQAL